MLYSKRTFRKREIKYASLRSDEPLVCVSRETVLWSFHQHACGTWPRVPARQPVASTRESNHFRALFIRKLHHSLPKELDMFILFNAVQILRVTL
jgi:hypothetical protein